MGVVGVFIYFFFFWVLYFFFFFFFFFFLDKEESAGWSAVWYVGVGFNMGMWVVAGDRARDAVGVSERRERVPDSDGLRSLKQGGKGILKMLNV